jgi:hypothetical protein
MQPGPNTGVWYYEKNGVGITWDTGVSGRFDPLLLAGSYNFGQLPFVGVGPGVGELTLCSPNMPASDVPHSRLGFHASEYDGNAITPRRARSSVATTDSVSTTTSSSPTSRSRC